MAVLKQKDENGNWNIIPLGTTVGYEVSTEAPTNPTTQLWIDTSVGSKVGDYVVEQGTDGIWTYRKWNSGIAECWGTSLHESVAMTHVQGGSWYSDEQTISFPTNLFNQAPKCINHNCRVNNGYLVCLGVIVCSASSISGYFNSINKSITTNVYTEIYARGTWK